MSSDKKEYSKILSLIESFSQGDFEARIIINESDPELELIAKRLNHLGENLSLSKHELDLQRYFISSVLDNIPADIAVFDHQQNYMFLNQQAISNEETRKWMIGKNDFDYCKFKGINYEIAVKRKNLFNEAVLKKSDVSWVDEHTSNEGTKYIMRKFHPVFENSQLKYVIGYGIDITGLKNSEKEKTRLIEELNSKYNDLIQFNYIVSHNLRSPITSILGLTDIMKMPGLSEEEKIKTVDHIRMSAIKMDELLKDLSILLTRSSTTNSLKENINIQTLINSIKDTLESQISQSETVIKTKISEDCKIISSIKSYLESILYNLISNAIKYRSSKRKPQILITTTKKNGNLILTVEDNGIGIDLNKYGKYVFGLYRRFHVETEGKGLGLHMTKTQVETLGGTISIESEPDKGTKFKIILPIT